MGAERRQHLRALFEEKLAIRTEDATDSAATGLDISLSGIRFHCETQLVDNSEVSVEFLPDFQISGRVCWCWPIEWYYQSAIQFVEITPEEQARLREYIIAVTGEDYPDDSKEEAGAKVAVAAVPTPANLDLDDDEEDWMDDLSEEDIAAAEENFDSFDDEGFEDGSLDDPKPDLKPADRLP